MNSRSADVPVDVVKIASSEPPFSVSSSRPSSCMGMIIARHENTNVNVNVNMKKSSLINANVNSKCYSMATLGFRTKPELSSASMSRSYCCRQVIISPFLKA